MKTSLIQFCASALMVALALALYDRLVFQPSRQIGVVDVGEVYRAKEAQFAQLLGKGEREHQQALALATRFAQRLPGALEELPRDCQCLVMLKSTVVGSTSNTIDLTALLKHKVELQ